MLTLPAARREIQTVAGAALASAILLYAPFVVGTFGILLQFFALLPLFLVTRRHGGHALIACLLLLWGGEALFSWVQQKENLLFFNRSALSLLVLYALPAAALLFLGSRREQSGHFIMAVALNCCLVTVLAWWGMQQDAAQQTIKTLSDEVLQHWMQTGMFDAAGEASLKKALADTVRFIPAIAGISWFGVVLCNLLLCQRLLKTAPAASIDFSIIQVPFLWIAAVALIILAAASVGSDTGTLLRNLLAVMLCPLAIAGFFVARAVIALAPQRQLLLAGLYLLLFLQPLLWVVLAALGGADRLFHVRRKLLHHQGKD